MKALLKKDKLYIIALLLLITYLLGVRILLIFSYSVDLVGLEFVFVTYIQNLVENKPLYSNPAEFPYLSCLYTPVFLYSFKFITVGFSYIHSLSLHGIYIIGRSFTFLLLMIQIGIFVGFLRKRFNTSWQSLLIFVALYLLLLSDHVYAIRPDSMKLLFFTCAFLLLVEYAFFNPKLIYLIGVSGFMVLEVYTKQDSIVYLSIIIVVLFFVTRKIKYVALLLVSFAFLYLVFLLLQIYFGVYFFTNVVLFNFQQLENVFTSINVLFVLFSVARILPLVFLVFMVNKYQNGTLLKTTLQKYIFSTFLVLFLTSNLFILRAGSFIHYSYECIFVLIFFILMQHSFQNKIIVPDRLKVLIGFYIIFIFSTNIFISNYLYSFKKENELKTEYYNNIRNAKEIKSIVKDDVVFYFNLKYLIFARDMNLIYGYDYNIGRLMEAYLSIKTEAKLIFFDSYNYDNNFKNGKVRYIIIDNNKDYLMKKYYPGYSLFKQVGNLCIYSYK